MDSKKNSESNVSETKEKIFRGKWSGRIQASEQELLAFSHSADIQDSEKIVGKKYIASQVVDLELRIAIERDNAEQEQAVLWGKWIEAAVQQETHRPNNTSIDLAHASVHAARRKVITEIADSKKREEEMGCVPPDWLEQEPVPEPISKAWSPDYDALYAAKTLSALFRAADRALKLADEIIPDISNGSLFTGDKRQSVTETANEALSGLGIILCDLNSAADALEMLHLPSEGLPSPRLSGSNSRSHSPATHRQSSPAAQSYQSLASTAQFAFNQVAPQIPAAQRRPSPMPASRKCTPSQQISLITTNSSFGSHEFHCPASRMQPRGNQEAQRNSCPAIQMPAMEETRRSPSPAMQRQSSPPMQIKAIMKQHSTGMLRHQSPARQSPVIQMQPNPDVPSPAGR